MHSIHGLVPLTLLIAASAAPGQEPEAPKPPGDNPATVSRPVRADDAKQAYTPLKPRYHRAGEEAYRALEVDAVQVLMTAQRAGQNDPHRDVLLKLRTVANESCNVCHAGGASVKKDEMLGLKLVPADETLRAQLKLETTGLVVTAVAKGSTGEAGGIHEKDIIVGFGDKPVTDPEGFARVLVEATGAAKPGTPAAKPIVVRVVRAGKPTELKIPPPPAPMLVVGRLVNSAGAAASPSYWIGVQMNEIDDVLRAHLKLPEGEGLVVSDVIKESPAQRSGLKKDDVIRSIDEKPTKAVDDLVKAVQNAKGEATLHLAVVRGGEPVTIEVRPERRKDVPAPTRVETTFAPIPLEEAKRHGWVANVLPFIDANGQDRWTVSTFSAPVWQVNPVQPSQELKLYMNPSDPAAGQPVPYYYAFPSLGTDQAEAQKKQAEEARVRTVEEQRKLVEALDRKIAERVSAGQPSRETIARWTAAIDQWAAISESMKKGAPSADSLAKIDAQLKALDAQLGDLKRSVEELKGAMKKEK